MVAERVLSRRQSQAGNFTSVRLGAGRAYDAKEKRQHVLSKLKVLLDLLVYDGFQIRKRLKTSNHPPIRKWCYLYAGWVVEGAEKATNEVRIHKYIYKSI